MLYARTIGSTTLHIPRLTSATGTLRLELTPTAGGAVAWGGDVTDGGDLVYYYTVSVSPALPPGEYAYALTADGVQVSDGLLMVEPAADDVEVYAQPREIVQYEG